MLEDFFYNIDSEEAKTLIKIINEEGAELNQFLLFNLEVINHSLETLEGSSISVIEIGAVKKLVECYLLSDKVLNLIKNKRKKIKLDSSIVKNLKINAESIVNGVEKVAELNKKNMVKTDALTLFLYLGF